MSWWAIVLTALGLSMPLAAPDRPPPLQGRCRDGRVWTTSAQAPAAMLTLMNQARAAAGRRPLVRHPVLDRMALAQAVDMACRNYFDHLNPERESLPERLKDANDNSLPAWRRLAEVIGTSDEPARQNQLWLASREHRQLILDANHDRVGIGVARIAGSNWSSYWAADLVGLAPPPRR